MQDSQPTSFAWLSLALRNLALNCVCLLVLGGYIPPTFAAQQGSSGLDSDGSIDVTLVTGNNVRLSGLADMALGTWSGAGSMSADDNICIGRTGISLFGTGSYRIHASGDGEPGDPAAFTLSNGFNQIHYNAFFNDAVGTAGRQQLTPGVAMTGQTGFGFWLVFNYLFGCFNENANISIEVPETELTGGAGNYTGTLTLVLIPE